MHQPERHIMSEQKILLPDQKILLPDQKLSSIKEKKSLRELRTEKAQQIRKEDLAFWAHSGNNHKNFVKQVQNGLASAKNQILSDIDLNKVVFSCGFSIHLDPLLHSDHAEGYILPEYLSRQLEMEFRGWYYENDIAYSTPRIFAGKMDKDLTFRFDVDLSKPYRYYGMPFEPETEGFAFVEE